MSDIQSQLRKHLEEGNDWEKLETPFPAVSIVRVPATKTRPALLFLDINPLNDKRKPMKKKGLYIDSKDILQKFIKILNDDKIHLLISEITKVNSFIPQRPLEGIKVQKRKRSMSISKKNSKRKQHKKLKKIFKSRNSFTVNVKFDSGLGILFTFPRECVHFKKAKKIMFDLVDSLEIPINFQDSK